MERKKAIELLDLMIKSQNVSSIEDCRDAIRLGKTALDILSRCQVIQTAGGIPVVKFGVGELEKVVEVVNVNGKCCKWPSCRDFGKGLECSSCGTKCKNCKVISTGELE